MPSKKEKLPLSVTHPELAKEANGWDVNAFTYGSGKVLSWKCALGHCYETSIDKRTLRGHSCPFCSGHKVLPGFNDLKTTHPEIAAEAFGWSPTEYSFGSVMKLPWKCPSDHEWKATVINRVKQNQGCAVCANKQIIVGVNDLATTHPDIAAQALNWDTLKVVAGSEAKLKWICHLKHIWVAKPVSRTKQSSGCPVCTGRLVEPGFNDLETTNPEIASQAFEWDPKSVSKGSNKKKFWRCSTGHIWQATVSSRINGSNCPVCSGHKVLPGFNDLETTHPELAKEAEGWNPQDFSKASNKVMYWKCEKNHSWMAKIGNRTSLGHGCPTCSTSGFDPNKIGYLYLLEHPDWEMYQIGISNDPNNRLSKHQRIGWTPIELRGPMDGHLTQQWETAILRMLKAKGVDLSNSNIAGKFDGYSEAWSKSTFQATSIKELMRLTEEFEEQ